MNEDKNSFSQTFIMPYWREREYNAVEQLSMVK